MQQRRRQLPKPWTHPGSLGIFTKLNTSMCAADCSQGLRKLTSTSLRLHRRPHSPPPPPRCLLWASLEINNLGPPSPPKKKEKKWSFHKSGGEISPVVWASAWMSDCCVLASAAQIQSPRKRMWQGEPPPRHHHHLHHHPGYILQSMPLLAALSHLHLISIAVE